MHMKLNAKLKLPGYPSLTWMKLFFLVQNKYRIH